MIAASQHWSSDHKCAILQPLFNDNINKNLKGNKIISIIFMIL